MVAAILHLGNIVFAKGPDVDSSVLKDDKAKFHLRTAAELLMYDWIYPKINDVFILLLLVAMLIDLILNLGVILLGWKMLF